MAVGRCVIRQIDGCVCAMLGSGASLPSPKNCKTSQSTSKNPFCFPRPSRHDLTHFAPHPLPPPHVAPGARCHVAVQSAVSSSPSSSHGMRVSRWHTDTPSAPPSRYYGTIVVVVWCTLSCTRASKFDYNIAGDPRDTTQYRLAMRRGRAGGQVAVWADGGVAWVMFITVTCTLAIFVFPRLLRSLY